MCHSHLTPLRPISRPHPPLPLYKGATGAPLLPHISTTSHPLSPPFLSADFKFLRRRPQAPSLLIASPPVELRLHHLYLRHRLSAFNVVHVPLSPEHCRNAVATTSLIAPSRLPSPPIVLACLATVAVSISLPTSPSLRYAPRHPPPRRRSLATSGSRVPSPPSCHVAAMHTPPQRMCPHGHPRVMHAW